MIDIYRIPFEQTLQFSKIDIGYAGLDPKLKDFYAYPPTLEAFQEVLKEREKQPVNREALVQELRDQYQFLKAENGHFEDLLKENHFTVTTAHQPSLMTGPLYFIYKIFSTIHTARQLNSRYRGYRFHPVFVLGGEDHDFEEINHLTIFGKTIRWEDEKGGQTSVGRMSWNHLSPALEELKGVLGGSDNAEELKAMIDRHFIDGRNYGQCMQSLVIELFQGTGLIVLNMDSSRLKGIFRDVMREELLESPSIGHIEDQQSQLQEKGFKAQAMAREINLFYLTEEFRERIERDGENFRVVNRDITFTKDEILEELENHPGHFSPNVCLRPLYQELILPNLAYIGGGGEIAYWLERKTQFAHFGLHFPMLIRRNSVLWIDSGISKDMHNLGLGIEDLFRDKDELVHDWLKQHASIEISVEEEMSLISKAYASISEKASVVDPTLQKAVEAEKVRQLKSADQLGKRLVRAEKANNESMVNKIQKVKDKLFPGGGLQERQDNFMQFYLKYGRHFFDVLSRELSPFEKGLIIVLDHKESGGK